MLLSLYSSTLSKITPTNDFNKILFSLLTFIKNDDIIIFEKGCENSGAYKGAFKSGENTGNAVSANAR